MAWTASITCDLTDKYAAEYGLELLRPGMPKPVDHRRVRRAPSASFPSELLFWQRRLALVYLRSPAATAMPKLST